MDNKRLLIVDDHPVFRAGLKQVVIGVGGFEVVAEADTGESALMQIRHLGPDIVMLDLAMPGMDGLEVMEHLSEEDKLPMVIVVTSYDDKAYLDRAFELGARAFVIKDSAVTDLVDCLEAVCNGGIYISPSLGRNKPLLPKIDHSAASALEQLTPTERHVLVNLAQFKTSKHIAKELGMSYRTVQNHRSHICSKLGLKGSHQLMCFAAEYAHLLL